MFGMQHMLHSNSELPTLHLIAKSKLTVLSLPVSSVQFFAKPHALHIAAVRSFQYFSTFQYFSILVFEGFCISVF